MDARAYWDRFRSLSTTSKLAIAVGVVIAAILIATLST